MAHCKNTFYHIMINVNTRELGSTVVRTSMNKNAMLMIIIHGPNPLGLKICQAERLKTYPVWKFRSV